MVKKPNIKSLFKKHNCNDFKWINPKDIVVSQWVRMKCMFGCREYGRKACCPPNVPSVPECRQFISEYSKAAVFHFAKAAAQPEERRKWLSNTNRDLINLERAVFLAGYQKAFILFMAGCELCKTCAGFRHSCKVPRSARPTPEAMAVDVFFTVRKIGYPITVLKDYHETENRYAFLLIE